MLKFKETAIYKDLNGKKLIQGNQPMNAMFMSIFARECYSNFKIIMTNHFSDPCAEPWKVDCSYKSNVVRIWQKIAEYEYIPFLLRINIMLIKILHYSNMVFITTIFLGVAIFAIALKSSLAYYMFELGVFWFIIVLLFF